MVSVLIVIAPLTSSVVRPVTVSVGPLPNTALPSTVRLWLPPASVPFVVTVLPFRTVSAPRVTSSLYVCIPVVVTVPPLISVMPPTSVVRLAAATPPPNVVVPVLFMVRSPRACVPPTGSLNVTAPLPALIVNALVSPVAELTLLLNKTGLLSAVSVVPVPIVTAPVQVCEPEVVRVSVLIVDVPLTSSVVRPVTVSAGSLPNTASPSTVKLLLPPVSLPFVVTVTPFSTVPAPSVTSSLYC